MPHSVCLFVTLIKINYIMQIIIVKCVADWNVFLMLADSWKCQSCWRVVST